MEKITRILNTLGPFGCTHIDVSKECPEYEEVTKLFEVDSIQVGELHTKMLDNAKLKLYRKSSDIFVLEVLRCGEGILGIY